MATRKRVRITRVGMWKKLNAIHAFLKESGNETMAVDIELISMAVGAPITEPMSNLQCDCDNCKAERAASGYSDDDEWDITEIEVGEDDEKPSHHSSNKRRQRANDMMRDIMRQISEKSGIPMGAITAVNMESGERVNGDDLVESEESTLLQELFNDERIHIANRRLLELLRLVGDNKMSLLPEADFGGIIQRMLAHDLITTVKDVKFLLGLVNKDLNGEFEIIFMGPDFTDDAPLSVTEFIITQKLEDGSLFELAEVTLHNKISIQPGEEIVH